MPAGSATARKYAQTRLKSFACQGRYEREARLAGYQSIAGVDEVGRGSLFGPVFAAAVVLDPERPIRGLRDSKILSEERREVLVARIRERALAWAIGVADVFEIDRINIYQASLLAMRRAVEKLSPAADFLLLDAVKIHLPIAQRALIHGDAKSQCIAAASILAKTERDACMRKWDEVFPHLGLCRHKGYSTEEHLRAIQTSGPTMLHRFSFEPVRLACPYPVWTGYDLKENTAPAEAVSSDDATA
ncbi:MAG TPA: ribonuclease HII [Bryobacteraceae bacterium]|nr:ribonuclease HII [Bryobacteraceae bacterium]